MESRQDVRCPSGQLLGRVDEHGRIEVRCIRCRDAIRRTYGQRVVVFHYLTPEGGIVDTKIYADAGAVRLTGEDLAHAIRRLGWGDGPALLAAKK